MSARLGRLMPKEGIRTGKGTPSPWLPAVSLPASPLTCLPLADFFQACFLSTADSSGYDREQAAMQITCEAAGPLLSALQHRRPGSAVGTVLGGLGHRAGESRAPLTGANQPCRDRSICTTPLLHLQPELSPAKILPCFHQQSPPPAFRVRAGKASKSPPCPLLPHCPFPLPRGCHLRTGLPAVAVPFAVHGAGELSGRDRHSVKICVSMCSGSEEGCAAGSLPVGDSQHVSWLQRCPAMIPALTCPRSRMAGRPRRTQNW